MVIQVGARLFGVLVDSVFRTEEIVVKPMSSLLRDVGMFSGNTILGDGSVIMIIDPNALGSVVGAVEGQADLVRAAPTVEAATSDGAPAPNEKTFDKPRPKKQTPQTAPSPGAAPIYLQ